MQLLQIMCQCNKPRDTMIFVVLCDICLYCNDVSCGLNTFLQLYIFDIFHCCMLAKLSHTLQTSGRTPRHGTFSVRNCKLPTLCLPVVTCRRTAFSNVSFGSSNPAMSSHLTHGNSITLHHIRYQEIKLSFLSVIT